MVGTSADESARPGPNTVPAAQSGEPQQPTAPVDLPEHSPFVRTDSDPFATFAADVDTASYDILRRSLLVRSLPPASEVRVEEFVNYFRYDYPRPAPGAETPFAVSLTAGPSLADASTKILRVGIQGAIDEQKRPTSLVFLVDVSGSMASENKLPLVQKVLREALTVLAPSDTVAIVSYAGDTRVVLQPTASSERQLITRAIDALGASGGTNGASGIELAYQEANRGFLEAGVNHVILCTDGDFNLGVTSNDALVALIERKRKSGVTLTALGVGERNNDAMMERVSNAGNGIYSVLYNEDQAIAYTHQRLLSTMQHIAKDVKIQVEFNPELVYAYRLLGYEDRALWDDQFRDDRIDAGEIGSGHQVTALFELALTQADLPSGVQATRGEQGAESPQIAAQDLVQVHLRWKRPGASEADVASERSFALAHADLLQDAAALDADTVWALGVAKLAEVLRHSPYATDKLDALGRVLTPLAGDDPERRELISFWPELVRLEPR
jgi:Ca-activated chloride channel family protein